MKAVEFILHQPASFRLCRVATLFVELVLLRLAPRADTKGKPRGEILLMGVRGLGTSLVQVGVAFAVLTLLQVSLRFLGQ